MAFSQHTHDHPDDPGAFRHRAAEAHLRLSGLAGNPRRHAAGSGRPPCRRSPRRAGRPRLERTGRRCTGCRGRHWLAATGAADRCRIVAGSFFEEVPAGGDAYVLKSILHHWEDPEASVILRVCRRAMSASGRLVVLERIVAPAQ
ncbi:MAG: hypothetical protein JOZ87_04680 [Chloroflexi bacterium]|nr:hypothetical protein [Chloroflexota bacterium]